MQSQDELLMILADGSYHSGAALGKHLAISRAGVWKRVRNLQNRGVVIEAVKGKGYRITQLLELLDHDNIISRLDDGVKAKINQLTLHKKIASTNQYLLDQVASGIHRRVALAEYQTAGRGRRGRPWISPFGAGICLSMGWQFDPAPDPAALIPLGAGVAVMRALQRAGVTGAGLKWPNDVLWQDRKLGGILVEMRMETAGPCSAVIGIGLNYSFPRDIDHAAGEIDRYWVDLTAIQKQPASRNLVAALLISEMVRLLEEIEAGAGQSIMDTWKEYDCINGKQARLILPDRSIKGRVLGIDQQGALIMSINGKLEHFNSGEISLRSE